MEVAFNAMWESARRAAEAITRMREEKHSLTATVERLEKGARTSPPGDGATETSGRRAGTWPRRCLGRGRSRCACTQDQGTHRAVGCISVMRLAVPGSRNGNQQMTTDKKSIKVKIFGSEYPLRGGKRRVYPAGGDVCGRDDHLHPREAAGPTDADSFGALCPEHHRRSIERARKGTGRRDSR
jgi:hypothetical protein